MYSRAKDWLMDIVSILIGSVIYGISVNVFILSGDLISGGATGLGMIWHRLTGFSIGSGIIIFNIPLFVFSIRKIGKDFLIKTILATVCSSIAVDIFAFMPNVSGDRFLACLFGGLTSGVGLAIIFMRGITTGGSDLFSHLIRTAKPRMKMGKLLLLIDGIIIACGTLLVYFDMIGFLYSIILTFVTSEVIDYVMSRTEKGALCFIVSLENERIEGQILKEMGRGATVIYGRGSFLRHEKSIIMCAIYSCEIPRLRKLVFSCDEQAFFIVANTAEVSGSGFLCHR